MYRYEVEWLVPGGGGGSSRFYGLENAPSQGQIQAWAASIRTMFGAITSQVPNVVSWTFGTEVAVMSVGTGVITDYLPITPLASLAGNAAGPYAAPVGGLWRWETTVVRNSRRVRGRTYLVPLVRDAFDGQGNLQANTITQLQGAAAAYLTANPPDGPIQPCVWSPPNPDLDPPRVGAAAEITQAVVPDLAVILRSRRD